MANQSKCDYSKGIIYKIKCRDRSIKDIYVGSTTNFVSRKALHKSKYNNPKDKNYNIPLYQFIRSHGGWDNWTMIPIKTYSCNSYMELRIEEQRMIEELEEYTTLNRHRAWRSEEVHKQKIAERDKRYYHNNKEKIKKYHKEYYEKNIEEILEKKKEYREKNKEEIKVKKSKKYECPCGGSWTAGHGKARHLRSIKHQTWEQQPEPNIIFID
jgi:hypothetical protein